MTDLTRDQIEAALVTPLDRATIDRCLRALLRALPVVEASRALNGVIEVLLDPDGCVHLNTITVLSAGGEIADVLHAIREHDRREAAERGEEGKCEQS